MAFCKCGGQPKAATPAVVVLRLNDVAPKNFFFAGIFIDLPPPPSLLSIIWAEDAQVFCAKDPSVLKDEFAPYSAEASTAALKKLWSRSCECKPERGSWRVRVFWDGYVTEEGGERWNVRFAESVFFTSRQPRNLAVLRTNELGGRFDLSLVASPPNLAPFIVGVLGANTTALFRIVVSKIEITFLPSGCYAVPPPPAPDTIGDYPSIPPFPFPIPPAFVLDPPPIPPPPLRPPPPPPPDECCECG